MKIIFKTLEPLELEIDDIRSDQTVSDLKSIICSKHGIDNNINLIYYGQNLLNNRKLEDYQINNDSCIQTFIDCPDVVENENIEVPSRNENRNVNSDNVNIMYEFSLGDSQTPINTFSTDNRIQLSDIFGLFSHISRNNNSRRNSARPSQSENHSTSENSNNPTRETENSSENINHPGRNNNSTRETQRSSENINHFGRNNNLTELWRLLLNLNSQSDFNRLLEYLNEKGLNCPIDELNSLINNLNITNQNRLSTLSSLMTIMRTFSESRESSTRHEIGSPNQARESSDYSHLVSQIKDMGFFDEGLIIEILTRSKGNINLTVETLLNRINNAR